MQSLDNYNKTMENYKANYPVFYNQLIAAMQETGKVTKSTGFKMFLGEYKFYLIAIGAGIGVIVYLLLLLFTR